MKHKKYTNVWIYMALIATVLVFSVSSCTRKSTSELSKAKNIAVFVPGIVSGSPVYEMLVAGVTKAVQEATQEGQEISIQVIEAGTKQADWGEKLTSLAAEKKYSVIVSSNPALPEIIEPISTQFPQQQFIIFDAFYEGNPSITTFRYNQREQAYLSGYMAALVSTSSMKYANKETRIGIIAGQEYPAMNEVILPAFIEGAKAINPDFVADFRVVGNWFDAAKAADLARAMAETGVDVIMPISGGANQGVITAAKEKGFYVAWFDDNGYAKAPGFVVSSAVMAQERLTYEKVKDWIDNKLETGKPSTVGIAGGYINFVDDDPIYIDTIPESLRLKQQMLLEKLKSGSLNLPVK